VLGAADRPRLPPRIPDQRAASTGCGGSCALSPVSSPQVVTGDARDDAFILRWSAGRKVAIVGGAVLLLTRRVKAEKIYREIDWPLLLMFVGLFIVVTALETAVITKETISAAGRLNLDAVPILAAVTAGLSNLVSNVPAVLVLRPFVSSAPDPQHGWLVVAMASTLAGNFTLESHRRATRPGRRRRHRLLGLFQNRRAAYGNNASLWHLVARKSEM
jgi:Citrate transporter